MTKILVAQELRKCMLLSGLGQFLCPPVIPRSASLRRTTSSEVYTSNREEDMVEKASISHLLMENGGRELMAGLWE